MWGGTDEAVAIRAVHAAIDHGINMIDTAPAYGFGTSEEIVGKAIRDRRDGVVLATKCGLVWHVEKGEHFFNADGREIREEASEIRVHRYLGAEAIRYEIEQSLTRLGVDSIDLYQTHWQDPTTPVEDTMEELLKLKDEGKIRAIGLCNATNEDMDAYRRLGPIDGDQERYGMLDRGHEAENLPYCVENDIAFLAYSPLALGLLSGKIGPERTFNEGDQRNNNPRFSKRSRERVATMLDVFKPIAEDKDLTLAQLVIAWTINQEGCTHALIGGRDPDQVIENAGAGDILLSPEELSRIAQAIDRHAAAISL
jgi:aryl-alcohol dehydrogenase-like predicted oxidoreductase